jgi:hypothetical protein
LSEKPNADACIHTDRPAYRNCISCGKGICYTCYIDDLLTDRITAEGVAHVTVTGEVSATGHGYAFETEKDYGSFCATCFLERVKSPSYRIFKGRNAFGQASFLKAEKPNILNPFSYGETNVTIIVYILMIALFGLGLLFLLITYFTGINHYNKFLEKKNKAESIVREMQ